MNPTCSTCRHAAQADPDPRNIGAPRPYLCRRYPPSPMLLPSGGAVEIKAVYPVMGPDATCGEHQPKLAS